MMLSVAARINPYPGLGPFEEKDASRFFGRDREIDEMLDRLASRHLLAAIGVSGCGKSSLVRAGIIPVLRIGAASNLPGHWQIFTITPGNDPLRLLQETLKAPPNWPITSFDLVDHARKKLDSGQSLLLIVDQFEEIFHFRDETLTRDGGNEASLFVNLLLKALEQREVPIYVLLTMRTDFLGKCTQFRGLPEALNDCYYLVPRMTRLQQQEAIECPLKKEGESMQPVLVQRLLNDSAEDPDHLPLLQHLLKRLWENWSERGRNGPIVMDDYDAVGGWANALNADAEKILKQFEADEERIRCLFQWITERGTGEEPIRRPRDFRECLEVSGLTQNQLSKIVAAFQERGLLKPSDLTNHSRVDLQHESVMWEWSRLRNWIEEEAEHAAQSRFFLRSARQNMVLTGSALDSALKWRSGNRITGQSTQRYLSPQELKQTEEWIVRSEEVRRRRNWVYSGILTIVLVMGILAFIVARKEQKSAEARELSTGSAVGLSEDPQRSLILGVYSWGKQRSLVSGLEEILHSAVLHSRGKMSLVGHQDIVRSVGWSPDGTRLATASDDHTAKVWDAQTGHELLILRGHQGIIRSIAWSPNGTKLATASDDSTAKVWDAGKGYELLTLSSHQNAIGSITWSPDGTKLATASDDHTAKVWDAETGHEIYVLSGHLSDVWSIAWSPDGTKLATASKDRTVMVWESMTGRALRTLRGHSDAIGSIAWSPDGNKLATASHDKTAKIWSAKTGHELLTLVGHQGSVWSIAWSSDGNNLATASFDTTAKVWDARTGHELLTLRGHQGSVTSISWVPQGSKLATASYDHTATIWETGLESESVALIGHEDKVWSIAWSPDGTKMATASGDHTSKVWEARSGRQLLTLIGHEGTIWSVAWSPDGTKLATASNDYTARVWDAGTGRGLLTLPIHQSVLSNTSRRLIEHLVSIAWSPDATELAIARDNYTAEIWDVVTGRQLRTLYGHGGEVSSIAWSPDGTKLATASSDNTGKLWDVGTGQELLTLHGHVGPVVSIAWSPDGSKLATVSSDHTAKIWKASTGEELRTLRGHQAEIRHIAWSPDGSKLATASDQTAKVWEADTGQELFSLRGHQAEVLSIAWAPDGKRLASAGADKIVQIYVVDPVELLRLVRSRVIRDLTSEECMHYFGSETCPALPELP